MSNKIMNEANESFYDTITPEKVFEELESRRYMDEIFSDILINVKETPSYVRLKEIALLHFTHIMSGLDESQSDSDIIAKRKTQTAQIGFLSGAIGSTVTKLISEKLHSLKTDIHSMIVEIVEELKEVKEPINKLACPLETIKLNDSSKGETCLLKEVVPVAQKAVNKKRRISENSDANEFSSSKRLSQRTKKPNAKYFSEDHVSTIYSSSSEEFSNESEVEDSATSKRKKKKQKTNT